MLLLPIPTPFGDFGPQRESRCLGLPYEGRSGQPLGHFRNNGKTRRTAQPGELDQFGTRFHHSGASTGTSEGNFVTDTEEIPYVTHPAENAERSK